MTLKEQIFAQARVMAQDLEAADETLLELLCQVAATTLSVKLREGLTPEDCQADFIAAASLYALAALTEAGQDAKTQQFSTGDITLRRGGSDAAACCLRYQAELLMTPYVKDSFCFTGV